MFFGKSKEKGKKSLFERMVAIEIDDAPSRDEVVPGVSHFERAGRPERVMVDIEPVEVKTIRIDEEPVRPEPVEDQDFSERSSPKEKFFDILERAKETPEVAAREIRIVYRVPKRVVTVPVREDRAYADPAEDTMIIETVDVSPSDNPAAVVEHAPEARRIEEWERRNDEAPEAMPPAAREFAEAVADAFEARADEIEEEKKRLMFEYGRYGALDEAGEAPAAEENAEEITTEPMVVMKDEPVTVMNAMGEPMQIQRTVTLEKVLFPEEYFYAKNGAVLKHPAHLKRALEEMDEETFSHHAHAMGTNDFANWIRHVFNHHECADELDCTRRRDEMLKVLDKYL